MLSYAETERLINELKNEIAGGQIDAINARFNACHDRHLAEAYVKATLEANASDNIVNVFAHAFIQTRVEIAPEHGYWVHSASHLTKGLWDRRMMHLVREFNHLAFRGACLIGDTNCSDRLVTDFADYAKWDDDPEDLCLDMNDLYWMDWKYCEKAKARIEHGVFESEEAFAEWSKQWE